jgi:hypothetical protein
MGEANEGGNRSSAFRVPKKEGREAFLPPSRDSKRIA